MFEWPQGDGDVLPGKQFDTFDSRFAENYGKP